MIRTIKIFSFKNRRQNRLKLVKVLAENNDAIGLKKAKNLQDKMLAGVPIDYELHASNLDDFIKQLEELEMEYYVIKAHSTL